MIITGYDLSSAGFCMYNPKHREGDGPMPLATHEVTITDAGSSEPPLKITCCERCAAFYEAHPDGCATARELGAPEA